MRRSGQKREKGEVQRAHWGWSAVGRWGRLGRITRDPVCHAGELARILREVGTQQKVLNRH